MLSIVGCGLTIVLVLMAIFVTEDISINKILFVFAGSAVLFVAECLLLRLKHVDLEKNAKKKADRRELLWLAIFFGALLIISLLQP